MVTGPEGRRRAVTRAASGSVGNGSASFAGPHVAVGNLRVSQTECPPRYATRITNIASVHPETLSFWNRWLNSDLLGRRARRFSGKLRVHATAIRNDPHRRSR